MTAFDPSELRRLVSEYAGPVGTRGDEANLAQYVTHHLDAILSALAPHAAVRDKAPSRTVFGGPCPNCGYHNLT